MKRAILLLLPSLLMSLLPAGSWAQERRPEQIREEAQALRERAEQSAAEGKEAEARELREKAERMIGDLERRESRGRPEHADRQRRAMAQRLEEVRRQLHEAEERHQPERAEALRRELRAIEEQLEPRPGRLGPEAEARRFQAIQQAADHLREAAARLEQAGMPDPAVHLRRQAEEMQRDLTRHAEEQQGRERERGLHDVVGRLHEEVARLRDEVEQLGRRVEELSRPSPQDE